MQQVSNSARGRNPEVKAERAEDKPAIENEDQAQHQPQYQFGQLVAEHDAYDDADYDADRDCYT